MNFNNTPDPATTATMPWFSSTVTRKQRWPYQGFTLVELLVVILIIIVLAALSFTAYQSIRRSAAKAVDINNLRSLAGATMAAGADNSGRLPNLHPSTNFPYYMKDRETLVSNGISKEMCYSAKGPDDGGAPGYKWWYGFGSSTPIHYCYFANDSLTGNSWFQSGKVMVPTKAEYRGATPYEDIIQDKTKAFARRIGDDAWQPVLWAGICRDSGNGQQLAAVTKDGLALGVNVMYLDGHVEWVDQKDLKARYTVGAYKVFW